MTHTFDEHLVHLIEIQNVLSMLQTDLTWQGKHNNVYMVLSYIETFTTGMK